MYLSRRLSLAALAALALGIFADHANAQGFRIPNTQPVFPNLGGAGGVRGPFPGYVPPASNAQPIKISPRAPTLYESVGTGFLVQQGMASPLYLGGVTGSSLGDQMNQLYQTTVISNAAQALQGQQQGQQGIQGGIQGGIAGGILGGGGQLGQLGQGGGGLLGGGGGGIFGGGGKGGGGGRGGGGGLLGGGGAFGSKHYGI